MSTSPKQNGKVNVQKRVSVQSADCDDNISNLIPTPPDGGWGWVIVASSLVCNIIVDGIGYSFGIFLPEFVRFFDAPRSKVSLIGSLLCGTYLCAGTYSFIFNVCSEPIEYIDKGAFNDIFCFKYLNPYLPNGPCHPYILDESNSYFRGAWCIFIFIFLC